VMFIALGALAVLGVMIWRWRRMVTATFSPDLSYAAGENPKTESLILALLLAVTIALSIKVVGVLLIASMLVIPAAAARPFAKTPEGMAQIGAALGIAAAVGGPLAALRFDTPVGPSIVVVLVVIYAASSVRSLIRGQ